MNRQIRQADGQHHLFSGRGEARRRHTGEGRAAQRAQRKQGAPCESDARRPYQPGETERSPGAEQQRAQRQRRAQRLLSQSTASSLVGVRPCIAGANAMIATMCSLL